MNHLNVLDLEQSPVTHSHYPKPYSLKILLTNISSDSHTWNLVFMQLLLEFMGHEVVNLGALLPRRIDH